MNKGKKKYLIPRVTVQEYEVVVDLLTESNNDNKPDNNIKPGDGYVTGPEIKDSRRRGYSSGGYGSNSGWGSLW